MSTHLPAPSASEGSLQPSLALRANLPSLVTLLIAALVLAIYFRPLGDLDFAWQIRTGGEIFQTGRLQVEDSFTYTIDGQHLPDFEWLYEVLLWAIWTVFGYGGLHLLKTICVLTPLALVARRLRREGVGWHVVLVMLAIAVLALKPTWNLRPFYVTTIGLLLLSGWLRDHCTGRRPISWEVPLLMLLWGNMHPGVITGQGLLAGAIGWEWIRRGPAVSRRLIIVGTLGLVASCICPGPIERLQYTFDPNLAHPIMRGFVEMQPLHQHIWDVNQYAALAYVIAGLVLISVVCRIREYFLWEIALLGGLAVLANFAMRSLQDWLLVMMSVGIPNVVAMYRQRRPSEHSLFDRMVRSARRLGQSPPLRYQPAWTAAILIAMTLFSLTPALANSVPRKHGNDWPIGAAEFIEREGLHGRFFSNPNYGAYLVWRLGPERARCYVDTRGFFFPPQVLENSMHILATGDDWQRRLKGVLDAGTDYFVLETQGPGGALWREIEGDVVALYRDDQTAVISAEQLRQFSGGSKIRPGGSKIRR